MNVSKEGILEFKEKSIEKSKACNVFNEVKEVCSIFLNHSIQEGKTYIITSDTLEKSVKQLTNYLKNKK